MPLHPARTARRTSHSTRSGITVSAVALALAGLATPAAADPEAEHYEVVGGDSLASIATEHGLEDGWRVLFDANDEVADPDLIFPGQVLLIPPPDADLDARPLPDAAPAPAPDQGEAPPAPEQAAAGAETAPEPVPEPAPEPPPATTATVWDDLAQCESGGNWQANTGNGYYGGLQFLPSTWHSVGGTGLPHEHPREEQIRRAEILQAQAGWGQWPSCSRQLGLR